jgi:hypothetical protein
MILKKRHSRPFLEKIESNYFMLGANGSEPHRQCCLLSGSAPITGDEHFRRSAIRSVLTKVCSYVRAHCLSPRVYGRSAGGSANRKPVWGSQAFFMKTVQVFTLWATADCGALRPSMAYECLLLLPGHRAKNHHHHGRSF